jgi:hypothetical protein
MSVKLGHSRKEAQEVIELKNTTRSVASGPKDRMEKLLHGETNSSYNSANIMSHQRRTVKWVWHAARMTVDKCTQKLNIKSENVGLRTG